MKQENGGHSAKRITFLMPYIDFCFMLIIIFVGMLSIAYFEPLGATNMENKQDLPPDKTVGLNKTIPPGAEQRRAGTNADNPLGSPKPLITNETQQQMLYQAPTSATQAADNMEPRPLTAEGGTTQTQTNHTGNAAQKAAAERQGRQKQQGRTPTKPKPQTRAQGESHPAASPVDAAKLLEQIRKMQEEIEKLKAHQGEPPNPDKGNSNHLYLDLRNKQE